MEGKRGKNEKKPGVQTPPLCEETHLNVPGFPGPRNLFHSSRQEGAGLTSETFRGITLCFGNGAGCAFSGCQRPANHLLSRGPTVAFGSGPKQVALRLSLEGDPALVWVRPAGRLPVTFFKGAQTERPSEYIINHFGEKYKGAGEDFFGKKWEGKDSRPNKLAINK